MAMFDVRLAIFLFLPLGRNQVCLVSTTWLINRAYAILLYICNRKSDIFIPPRSSLICHPDEDYAFFTPNLLVVGRAGLCIVRLYGA